MKSANKLALAACLLGFTLGVFMSAGLSLNKANIVGLWLLEEGQGKEIRDSINGVKGEFYGEPKWTKGRFGSGLEFHGSSDWIVTEDRDIFEFPAKSGFTLAVWFKTMKLPPDGESAFIGKGYADKSQQLPWYLLMYTDGNAPVAKGTVAMEVRKEAGANRFAIGKTEVNDGKWHHIAGVVKGKESSIYVDGVLDGTAEILEADYGKNDDPVIFMRQYDCGIIGDVDEFAILNIALTEKEIQELMQGGESVLDVRPGGKLTTMWAKLKSAR
jgi:hypothetical protein